MNYNFGIIEICYHLFLKSVLLLLIFKWLKSTYIWYVNLMIYILYYIYYVIYLNKSEDVECCLFTSMFRVSTHQMGFHHRENVNVQHFKICKNLIFTLSPTQTWVIPCQICMFFLDPLIKCYFCVLSSKLGPLWCLSGKCGHPCPFMRPSSIMGTF